MAKIEFEELKCLAYEVINENQGGYKIQDPKEDMLYSLAYNDGVSGLLDAIKNKFYTEKSIKKFDPEEAADDREKNKNI